jgi:lipopolysaccharide export system permease protein
VVVATANRRVNDVKRYDIEGRARPKPGIKENLHYLGAHGYVYLAATFNHANETLYDFVVQQYERNTLVRRIDAHRASWRGDKWALVNGVERRFTPSGESIQAFDEMFLPEIAETPEDFAKAEVDEENLTYAELRHYIHRVYLSGGNVRRYLVDLYFKLSFPFAGSIFVLIGIAFASGKRKQSIATGFGLTLVVSFMYYGVLRVGQTLGHNGVIPPLLAAQLGNIIFLVIGLFFLVRANR